MIILFKKQQELLNHMTDRQILLNLIFTQCLLLVLSVLFLFIFYPSIAVVYEWFNWNLRQILLLGGGLAVVVLGLDFILMKILPDHMFDDGGINEKLFQKRTITEIFFLTAFIAIAEELFFRGVLQSTFGLLLASVVFTLLHIRYLSKWPLFLLVTIVSFCLGIVYEWTGNLWVTIFSHFLIDFIFGLQIRYQYIRTIKGNQGETTYYDEKE